MHTSNFSFHIDSTEMFDTLFIQLNCLKFIKYFSWS